MLVASSVDATIDLNLVPALPGAKELLEIGLESTLAPDNRAVAGKIIIKGKGITDPSTRLLVDPQTGGGLVFGIQPSEEAAVLEYLKENGFEDATAIGHVIGESKAPSLEIC